VEEPNLGRRVCVPFGSLVDEYEMDDCLLEEYIPDVSYGKGVSYGNEPSVTR
jgi:hypothetical protein